MSPILVRPVREQLEHDRIIRLLQDQVSPSLRCRHQPGRGAERRCRRRVLGHLSRCRADSRRTGAARSMTIIEVETVESVNHLEALAEWVTFGRLKPAVSSLCALRDDGSGQAALHRSQRSRGRDPQLSPGRRRDAVRSRLPRAGRWPGSRGRRRRLRWQRSMRAPTPAREAAPKTPARAVAPKKSVKPPAEAGEAGRKQPRRPRAHPSANSLAISAVYPRQARV